MSVARPPASSNSVSEPAWEIARLFPDQGDFSDGAYLIATRHSRRLAELDDGKIEVLPMPTTEHQFIVLFLCNQLQQFGESRKLGRALLAPLRVRLREGKFREPDVVFMLTENRQRMGNEFWDGADLVMEVVSEDDRNRDLVTKRREYAEAGISEYWIVDPRDQSITVLTLIGGEYTVHGEFRSGGSASSVLLPGFITDVNAVFAAGRFSD